MSTLVSDRLSGWEDEEQPVPLVELLASTSENIQRSSSETDLLQQEQEVDIRRWRFIGSKGLLISVFSREHIDQSNSSSQSVKFSFISKFLLQRWMTMTSHWRRSQPEWMSPNYWTTWTGDAFTVHRLIFSEHAQCEGVFCYRVLEL